MTATLVTERPAGAGPRSASASDPRRAVRPAMSPWPLKALLVLFPLWWALGLGAFAFPLSAVPMLVQLWRRRSALRYPPGFAIWAAFLVLNVISLVMFTQDVPGTTSGPASGRVLGLGLTLVEYFSATVTLLYVGNLSLRALSQRRLVRWLGILGLVTIAGGLLGVVAPHFGFTSPVEMLLPTSIRTNLYVQALVHPASAQIQAVLGSASTGRPAAPFGYANYWGNNLSILLIWVVLWQWRRRNRGRQLLVVAIIALAMVPVVESLNRGVWIGIAVSALYLAVQLARRGQAAALAGLAAVAVVGGVVFVASPLHTTVTERLSNPGSNDLRSFLTADAISGAEKSPIVGWGGARNSIGSAQSLAIGANANCPQCGGRNIGSNGQLWYVLFAQGFVGAVLYVGFFVRTGWRYVRSRRRVSAAAGLVLLLAPFYSLYYNNLPSALTLTFISLALAWREESQVQSVPRGRPNAGESVGGVAKVDLRPTRSALA